MRYSQLIISQRQALIAFFAGIIFMAALVLLPPAAAALSNWINQDSIVPPIPANPDYLSPAGGQDTGNPDEPYLKELVHTAIPETTLTG